MELQRFITIDDKGELVDLGFHAYKEDAANSRPVPPAVVLSLNELRGFVEKAEAEFSCQPERLYQVLAQYIGTYQRHQAKDDHEGQARWARLAHALFKQYNLFGSFDAKLLLEDCTENKIVFEIDFHHMNDNGYWDGWTSHIVRVWPDLSCGFRLTISGVNKHDIKDYLHEVADNMMNTVVTREVSKSLFDREYNPKQSS
jgi:hypothetical protein